MADLGGRPQGKIVPSHDAEHRQFRMRALELAVQTITSAHSFTDGQIVRTAHLYEQFMWDGNVPPLPQGVDNAQV